METLEQIAIRLGFVRLLDHLDDLSAAVPGQGNGLTAELAGLTAGFEHAFRTGLRTDNLLIAAWSSPSPRAALQNLQQALDQSARLTDLVCRAGVAGLEAVVAAQSAAAAAVLSARLRMPQVCAADVHGSILAHAAGVLVDLSLVVGVPGVADGVDQQLRPGVFAAQHQVLVDLQFTLDGVIEEWDSEMRILILQLDVDYQISRAALGDTALEACGPGPGLPAVSASKTDANLRLALQTDKTSTDPAVRAFAESTQKALDQAAATAGKSYLLVYDPDFPEPQGALAIGVGDLETASHVLLMAGGVGTGPDTVPGDITDATAILAAANAKDPGDLSAAIVYAGYDAPFGGPLTVNGIVHEEVPAILNLGYATAQGAIMRDQLSPILNSLPARTNVTAVLHSFGTTVGAAAVKAGLPVDQIVYTGSPGVGFTEAGQVPINPAFQFVVANVNDPVVQLDEILQGALSGLGAVLPLMVTVKVPDVLGPNPALRKFGAQLIDQQGGLPLFQAHQTPAYLTEEGVENVAAILTEQYDDVEIVGEN